MTSSLGLKMTNGLPSSFSKEPNAEVDPVRFGRRVDKSSKSFASVLGYFERSSVGAN
jgi:hypothetical protein